jgi:hypothetical protein
MKVLLNSRLVQVLLFYTQAPPKDEQEACRPEHHTASFIHVRGNSTMATRETA